MHEYFQMAVAGRMHLVREAVDIAAHRAALDELQELAGRAHGLAPDLERHVVAHHVRQRDRDLLQLTAQTGRGRRLHFQFLALHQQLARDVLDARPGLVEFDHAPLHMSGKLEHAVPVAIERKVLQVALDAQAQVVGMPGQQRIVQPVVRLPVQSDQRRIARSLADIPARQADGQVQHTGRAALGTVAPEQIAFHVFVGHGDVIQLQRKLFPVAPPAGLSGQRGERYRLAQHTGASTVS